MIITKNGDGEHTSTSRQNMTPTPDKHFVCMEHPQLQEDLILIKNELGIKEYQNGERDKQIQHATQRIQQIGERAEDEDKTIKDEVLILKTEFSWMKKLQWAIFIMLLGLLGTIIFFFIEFNWKTFVLGI